MTGIIDSVIRAKRLKRVDAVRWRLLSADQQDLLKQVAMARRQTLGTVLRILARRFDGDVSAYWRAACQPHRRRR